MKFLFVSQEKPCPKVIEKVQYKTCSPITIPIQGISRESLCDELSFLSLTKKLWYN